MSEQSATRQYFASLIVGILKICDGMIVGFVSPSLLLLKSPETPLPSGEISNEEESWIGALMSIGGIIGILLWGFLTKIFGRKWPLISLVVPSIIGWLLVLTAQNVHYLYASSILTGIAIGGSYVITPVFMLEIANNRIRGILSASIPLNENLGIVLGYAIGGFCQFHIFPIVAIALNLLFCISMAFLPETPAFLLAQNKISETEKSIRYYRNVRKNDTKSLKLLMEEYEKLTTTMNGKIVDGNGLRLSDFTTRPGSKALMIGSFLALLFQFSGSFCLTTVSSIIFEASGSSLPVNVSSVIVQAIQVIGVFVVEPTIDRAGRRILYIISTIGTALGYLTLGIYMMVSENSDDKPYKWIPIVSFAFILFISSCGITSVVFPVCAEILPHKLKEIGYTFFMVLQATASFVILMCFQPMATLIGFHGCMFFFASVCIVGAVFIIIFLPETKAKSYLEIMELLK